VATITETTYQSVTLVRTYTYDELGRLVRAAYNNGTTTYYDYRYDAAGNRIESTELGVTRQYGHTTGNRLDEVTGGTTWEYEYDLNGAVTTETRDSVERTYTYDGRERMTGFSDGTATWTYGYDARAWRVSKTNGTVTYRYFRDGRTLEEYQVTGGVTPSYSLLKQYLFRQDGFTPWLMCDDDECRYVFTDHLGTPIRVFDEDGVMAWAATLKPFGEEVAGSEAGIDQPVRFPGQWKDGESGEYYNWWRYYRWSVGRYSSLDLKLMDAFGDFMGTVVGDLSWNGYIYANSNSLMAIDASGYYPAWVVWSAGVVLVTYVGNLIGSIAKAINDSDASGFVTIHWV